MRLSRPIYEALPASYLVLGSLGWVISYLDSSSARAVVPFVLGLAAQVGGVTVFLHRRDCRSRRTQYPCESIEETLRS